jgi:hypothetical protein
MDDALFGVVLERLEQQPLSAEPETLLLAAFSGEDELRRALGGEPMARPVPADRSGQPPGFAFLESLEVTGVSGHRAQDHLASCSGARVFHGRGTERVWKVELFRSP